MAKIGAGHYSISYGGFDLEAKRDEYCNKWELGIKKGDTPRWYEKFDSKKACFTIGQKYVDEFNQVRC